MKSVSCIKSAIVEYLKPLTSGPVMLLYILFADVVAWSEIQLFHWDPTFVFLGAVEHP